MQEENNLEPNPNTPEASVVVAPQKPKRFNFPKFNLPFGSGAKRAVLMIGTVILVTSLVVLVIYFVYQNFMQTSKPQPSPTPPPTETPSGVQEEPSFYANDEEVLAIEEKVKEIEIKLEEVDFRDDTLRVPSLDWNVSFDE